ncbi:integrase [Campylobacter sp. MIT 99-7217]|uniref:Mu transposase C-terminal domain-containing protein n=1 Tax=Campylobacter sp. MIT 99-7217 TaxID=535091 RepID=UPI0011598950|nr:DDE-type integrase/transposase/recombinase [Campylobacter sp. MIT 99-7217]TQR29179.1 integrase [Campylobacter sp. MIT 99-7217]
MWVNANIFCDSYSIGLRNLQKKAKKAIENSEKILYVNTKIFSYKYTSGKGHAGKTLQIWSKPLSKEEAKLVEQGFSIEDISCEFLDKAQSAKEFDLSKANIQALINTKTQNELLNKANTQKEPLSKALNDNLLLKNSKIKNKMGECELGSSKKASNLSSQNSETSKDELSKNTTKVSLKELVKQNLLSNKANSILDESLNTEDDLLINNTNNLSDFAKANAKKQNLALEKARVIKQWQKAKGKLSTSEFISYINAKKLYSFKLTQNKLFMWQKAYLKDGLNSLIDKRENKRIDELEKLGIKELFINTLLAQKGRLNASNIHRIINYEMASEGKLSLKDFLGKKDEFISYECVLRAMKKYLKENKLIKNIILHGEDGAISRHLPALGVSNWRVNTINEIVEIDASPLDAICKVDFINEKYGLKGDECSWHKRYTIISLIDTYSGVASFYLGFAEDSLSIARAIAKYISTYGLPKCIHSDNGKAFLSKNTKALLERLNIKYKAMPAYSGWAKPYVESKFKDLQNSLTANLVGYIGANIKERQAIEFFYSKRERRLKKGYKTNQRRLKTLDYMRECIDDYALYFMNNKWLDRLGATPKQSYEAKIEDAQAMDELSLSMYLGGELRLRKVLSKGLSLNGSFFYNPKLYTHEEVFVCENLNNQNEIFCFDKQKELLCVANNLDLEQGVSIEEAKEARKLVNRALKANKNKIDEQRELLEKNMKKYLELGKKELQKTKPPKTRVSNNAKDELEFSARLVSNGDFKHLASKVSSNTQEKRFIKWENAAKKAGY